MCWSGEASTVVATAGFVTAVYTAYKKQPLALCACIAYFAAMEALQAYTYSVIDQCDNPKNQVATLLGYLHISFQPFFINAVSLHFIHPNRARKLAPLAFTVCFAAAIMMIIKLYPFSWAGHCSPWRPMCGEVICAIHGNWHIAWALPVNDIQERFSWYLIAGFIMPALYGSWRFTIYHLIAGPLLAYTTTTNMNEWPAIWCLFSFGFIFVAFETPLRRWMYIGKDNPNRPLPPKKALA